MFGGKFIVAIGLVFAVGLSGCGSGTKKKHHRGLDPFAGTGSKRYNGKGVPPKGGGRYLVGKPYKVAGRTYRPREQPGYDKTGVASWYGDDFNYRKTSNGEWFNMGDVTAAHPTLPLPSYAKVTNLTNGRQLIVRINDRGPFVDTRIIDLSKRAAEILDYKAKGKTAVRVQYIGRAPLGDRGEHLVAMNRELQRDTSLKQMVASANRALGSGGGYYAAAPQKMSEESIASSVQPVSPNRGSSHELASDYYIQVGSFRDPDNAERTRRNLTNVGPLQVTELSGAQGTIYRVRLGPLHDQTRAETALNEVVRNGHSDAQLILASNNL